MNIFYTFFSEYEALPECPLSVYRRSKTRNISDYELLRKNYITEFFLLKCLLSIDSNLARPLNISVTDNGKPFIPGWNYHFSISHSNDLLVIAVDDKEIGVDCEYINKDLDYKKIMDRFFYNYDVDSIKTVNDFYLQWTKLESYAKKYDINLAESFKTDLSKEKFNSMVFKDYQITYC